MLLKGFAFSRKAFFLYHLCFNRFPLKQSGRNMFGFDNVPMRYWYFGENGDWWQKLQINIPHNHPSSIIYHLSSTPIIHHPSSNTQQQTSNIKHPSSNIKHPTTKDCLQRESDPTIKSVSTRFPLGPSEQWNLKYLIKMENLKPRPFIMLLGPSTYQPATYHLTPKTHHLAPST